MRVGDGGGGRPPRMRRIRPGSRSRMRREDRALPRPASRTRVPYQRHHAPARGASACSIGGSSAWGTCVRKGRSGVGRNGGPDPARIDPIWLRSAENPGRSCKASCSAGPGRAPQSLHTCGAIPNRVAPSTPFRKGVLHESPAFRDRAGCRRVLARARPACPGARREGPPRRPPRRPRRRSPAGHRPPRRARLPARSHAGGLQARHRHGRRLHRAGPRGDEGRVPRRPPRAEHRRDDRRRVQVPRAHARRRRRRWRRG